MFIELTKSYDNVKVLINLDAISAIGPLTDNRTLVSYRDNRSLIVVDDYEKIKNWLQIYNQCMKKDK